jgi:hypothetical protein
MNTSIQKRLVFAAPIAANFQLDTWIVYFKRISIYPDGSIHEIM